jgi:hypothetical protein
MSKDISYKDIRDQLKTGDLILFSGKSPIGRMIRLFSNSKWSHLGMVIKVDDVDMLLLWESTSINNTPDFYSRKISSGVQTTMLSERIENFDGDIAVRFLQGEIPSEAKHKLKNLRYTLRGRPYESSKIELIQSLLDMNGSSPNDADLSSVFCSELIAEGLKAMGIMDQSARSNEFAPRDFGDNGDVDKYLNTGYTYTPEILIK